MPVILSKSEWARIGKWTEDNKEDPDAARRRDYIKYLKETSALMTRSWPNSLENVNKRNEEVRQARIAATEQANTNFYKQYVKKKKEEQERLMCSARDTVFKNKDAPKMLLSAVIETAVLKERQEQIKFLNERRREKAEAKRRDDDDIIQKAKEWNELQELKKKRRFEVNKQHQKEILDQATEISERNRKEYEEELSLQKKDNIVADKQIAAVNTFDQKFKAAEKARILFDMNRSLQENAHRKREQATRDEMDDQLVKVLLRSRARIETKRKETEKESRAEKLRILENISKKLESGDADRDAKEQAILNKAIQEKEAAEEARREAQRRKQEQFRKQRVDARSQFLRDDDQRLHEFNTMRQWEIMNRFKNAEMFEDFQEKLREDKKRKIQEYKEDILKLWKERSERETQERASWRHWHGELAERRLRAGDAAVRAHARALLDEAARLGRPARPLHRALDQYCKVCRLYPPPPLPAALADRLAPPSAAAPAASGPRDGLHHPHAQTGAPKRDQPEWEREGSAAAARNGLQRSFGQHELKFPRITESVRAEHRCSCECDSK